MIVMEAKYTIAIVLGVVIILIVGGFLIKGSFTSKGDEVGVVKPGTTASQDDFKGATQYVDITATGLSASRVEIYKGDRVVWRNKDTENHWIASNLHPTHVLYPESGGCVGSKFDSCGDILPGESWAFIFNAEGTWGYHDDRNLQNAGEVVVKTKIGAA